MIQKNDIIRLILIQIISILTACVETLQNSIKCFMLFFPDIKMLSSESNKRGALQLNIKFGVVSLHAVIFLIIWTWIGQVIWQQNDIDFSETLRTSQMI